MNMNIAIVMTEGIGNMIMLTPTLSAIRSHIPDCRITVFGKTPALEILDMENLADETETDLRLLNGNWDFIGFTMWSGDVRPDSFQSGNVFECTYTLGLHEAESHFQMARKLGYAGGMSNTYCAIQESVYSQQLNDRRVNDGRRIIALCDTAQTGWECKRWPYFAELADRLAEDGYDVILIGGQDDFGRWTQNKQCLDLRGKLTVRESAGVLAQCDRIVTNDSWPGHAGGALGIETHVIFMPTRIDKNRPFGENVHVITKDKPCSPCQYTNRLQSCKCIKEITIDEVLEKIFIA